MNILHLTISTSGGAGIACVRLHRGLLNKNISSAILCMKDYAGINKTVPGIQQYTTKLADTFIRKGKYWLYERELKRKLKNQPSHLEIFSSIHSFFDVTKHPAFQKADIINLHWIPGFVDFTSFFRKNKKPVVWTLHDMYPFTGGCHHSDGCRGFEAECAQCPQLLGTVDREFANQQLHEKKWSLEDTNEIVIVTPSQWLGDLSRTSALFKYYRHVTIANGVPDGIFCSGDQVTARSKLGLPTDKKILLFVAQSVDNPRKGVHLLLDAINLLQTKDVLLVSAGRSTELSRTVSHQNLGTITSPEKMALAYQAADVFILPSLAENLPNTIAEALLCGTPVIAFGPGGIPEMITNGKNGYICDNPDPDSLANTIDRFFLNKNIFDKKEIEKNAFEKYNLDNQVSRYLELYKSLTSQN